MQMTWLPLTFSKALDPYRAANTFGPSSGLRSGYRADELAERKKKNPYDKCLLLLNNARIYLTIHTNEELFI